MLQIADYLAVVLFILVVGSLLVFIHPIATLAWFVFCVIVGVASAFAKE